MYDVRLYRSLTLTMIMLISALSPILMPVNADHEDEGGDYGGTDSVSLSIYDNGTSTWEFVPQEEEPQFLGEGTHEMELRSSNLALNDTYVLEWDVMIEEFHEGEAMTSENRSWIAYNNESSESFNVTVTEMTCEIMIWFNLFNQSSSSVVGEGGYNFIGPCGNNGVITTNIEIDGNDVEIESFHSENLWNNTITLDNGTYDMWWDTTSGTFTGGNDYLVEWSRATEGMSGFNESQGTYEWTAGSQSGIGLGSQGWNITVYADTCMIMNDASLWEVEYHANGDWDKDNSTLMGNTITDMLGPCEEPEVPHVELYYDNGSGPVMYEMIWEYEQFDVCNEYEEEDGHTYWECEVDYDGDGNPDDYWGFEHCEWDNSTGTYLCEAWPEVPHLEPGYYEFTGNISNLEVGADYELYANYYLNTQDNYESNNAWFSWNNSNESQIIDGLELDINEYMCSLHLQFDVYMNGSHLMHGQFSFGGDCEEMPELPSPFELYYDNGTGPVMWEPIFHYDEHDNCTQYDDGYWECEVDYDEDGNTDWYNGYENCEWDNNSMTYLCEAWWDYPILEPGNYTFTLNVSGLEAGEWHELEWWFNGNYDGMSFNATDEYEHFEWDIEIDEYMCGFGMDFHLMHYNGMSYSDYFHFKGLCEEMPSPFELSYDNGSGTAVMWEMDWNWEEHDDCTQYDEEGFFTHWECENEDEEGNTWISGHDHCEWDNSTGTYWCTTFGDYPYLEVGNYTLTLNVSGLEVGEWYDLYWYLNQDNDVWGFNATDEYEHFWWDIEVDEYMCGLHMDVELVGDGYNHWDHFGFRSECQEPVSDHIVELYYDNGTGPVMWEMVPGYLEFDDCTEYEEEDGGTHWECVDNEEGEPDDYRGFRNCTYDEDNDVYVCEEWRQPLLEPGDYTLTLNVTMLTVDTDYSLDYGMGWSSMMDFDSEEGNMAWTASDEYEHFEFDIEVDEEVCDFWLDMWMHSEGTNDTTEGFAYFGFNGLCEEPPQHLELYFNGMLYEDIMMDGSPDDDELYASTLEAGTNYMSWSMMDLEVGDEYNLSWSFMQMGMFDEEEGEQDLYTHIFAADNEEMMHDWEVEIENDTCYAMIVGVLAINGSDDWSGMLGMVWAMFNGPCEIEMGDVGLDMLNPDDGDWYEMDGMNGSETLGMLMTETDDEMYFVMSILEGAFQLETGDYTMRWVFEDLEVGKEYMVFMDDLMLDMDDEDEYAYHESCEEEYNEEEDHWYWVCEVENDDGSIDYLSYEYCYEYDDGWYECEVYDNDDLLTIFNASSDSEYYEWELTITDDTCGHVLLVGILDAESGEDSMPLAMGMYAIGGPNMSNCLGPEDDGPSPEDFLWMTDTDGDGNMSWDEFTTFLEEEDSVDNETMELFYEFFTESDWNGDGTLDLEELSYFLPMIMSLDDDPDGIGIEDLMYMADYDGDGNINWDEFHEFMWTNYGGDDIDNATWDYWADHFDEADADGDGQLNMDELYEFWSIIMSPDDGMDIEGLMNMADEDENGLLSWGEFLDYMDAQGHEFTDEQRDWLENEWGQSDVDGDGELALDELTDFWTRVNDSDPGDDDESWLEEYIVGQEWTVSLGYTDSNNFTYFLGATQMLSDSFRDGIDMNMGNGDGELNVTEAEEAMLMLLNELPQNPPGPDNITLNGVVGELIFVGYDIKNLASDSEDQPSIITMWDLIFHNVDANEDGQYKFAYPEDPYDEGVDVPADFCAISYEYSYEIIEFVWNNTVTDLDDLGECISLNAGEVVPSFSITYAQEANNDYDNDGVNNEDDAFPYDPSETMDSDGDGWGDNADAFPNDADEWIDTDGDGIGDNADTDYDGDGVDDSMEDSDGDGVNDDQDDFPNDANETTDSDGDGVGDNSDVFPNDSNESSDLDGDGIGDNSDDDADGDGTPNDVDAFPLTDSSNDADNDGVANDLDAFPNDPNEYFDSDNDGVGDNADNDDDNDGTLDSSDAFPYDPSETMDSDGDGWGDNADAFPNDASEKIDSDGDGVGDNADMFPSDTTEWGDTDGDGVGDNSDAFPNDASEIVDSDGDGVGNNADAFPYDSNEQSDSDGNGVGDNAQADQDGGGGTTPVDPEPVDDGGFLPGFSAIMGIVSMLGAAILVAGRRKD